MMPQFDDTWSDNRLERGRVKVVGVDGNAMNKKGLTAAQVHIPLTYRN